MTDARTPASAASDLRLYARALRTGKESKAFDIEWAWGLYGFTPEVVSTVLACVATGLPLGAAIDEATGGLTPSPALAQPQPGTGIDYEFLDGSED